MTVKADILLHSPSRRLGARFFALTLCAWACASAARAGSPGTSAATFLQLGFGARPIGFGGAFVPVANDASALYYNPAGLAYPGISDAKSSAGSYELLASQALLTQDVSMTQLGVVNRPFGLSLTHLSLGGIEQRSAETLEPEATVGASGLALGASYARKIGGVGVGVTAKYIRESIANFSASAYALDLGLLHRFESRPVSLGLDVANVGTQLRYVDQGYPLPMVVRFGAAYGLSRDFPHALVLQFDAPRDAGLNARLGFEYRGFGPIALRAGYRTYSSEQRTAALGKTLGSTASGIADFYGMSLGAGLRTPFGNLDYAMVPYGELGTAHRMSYSFNFGGRKEAAVKSHAP
ncbi:MAG: PorV/PorQ family protein [Elusimicrobia bacterium]|nr:PorV/PorQ family protein [Elusimicrobiota bacterium]